MKTRIAFLIFIVASTLCACKKDKASMLTVDFSAKNFAEKSIDLDDYVRSWNKVVLETDSFCLIDKSSQIYPCKDYIIVYSPTKILMFDYEGKYVKTVTQGGSGPGELNYLSDCIVDEDSQKLYYLEIFDTEHIHYISLKDGTVGKIPIAVKKMLKSIIFNYGSLACFPYVGNKTQACYTQDMNGNILDTDPMKIEEPDGPFVQSPINMFYLDEGILYQGIYEDTVYTVADHKPAFVFSKGGIRLEDVNKKDIEENQVFFNSLFSSNNHSLLGRVVYVLKATDSEGQLLEMVPDEYRYYLYDNNQKQVSEIVGCTFPPLSKKYTKKELPDIFPLVSSLNPHKIVVALPADELGGEFDDNPILFVGDLDI